MVKITTDTTSMYTVSEGKAMGIDLVPMTLIAGDKSYREIEEINVDELKELIEAGVKLTTSQPAVGEVMNLFEEASEEYLRLLKSNGIEINQNAESIKGGVTEEIVVDRINSAVINGNSVYYIKPQGSDKIYNSSIEVSDKLPLLTKGDKITITRKSEDSLTITKIK